MFGNRIFHTHAKDTLVNRALRARVGIYADGWWRYCIPGDGVVDWGKVVARLEDFGFNGIISVELEDYRYWKDWPAQLDGLRRARAHLAKWVR